jgi:Protein of unknown function (DUF3105)
VAHPNSKRAKNAKTKRAQERKTTGPKEKSKTESKKIAREEKAAEERKRRERQDMLRKVRNGAIVAGVVGLAGFGLWSAFKPGPELEGVEKPPNQGINHVNNANYDNPAPTSGGHSPNAVGCGIYSEAVPPENAVHSMEHGSVIVWYTPDQPELAGEILAATSQFDSHVIISPNPGIESAVVATAWNRRKAWDSVTDDMVDFVDIYRQRGPESVPCPR